MAKRVIRDIPTSDAIRRLLLQYFYDRNRNATSSRGKKGSAVKISDVKRELKAQHGLTQQEVQSNLTYLLSQGWVEEKKVEKQVRARGGTIFAAVTNYYQITAAGIDKIEGPGEFTMPKFQGINIQATGQNIITLGDGNQIDARFTDLGHALVELRNAITHSDTPEANKMSLVADIDTIQSQLAKPEPNKSILGTAWQAVESAAAIAGCADLVHRIGHLIQGLLA
ncbi:MAG: hypothetical protein ABSC21_17005 [Terriglobia bacterium]